MVRKLQHSLLSSLAIAPLFFSAVPAFAQSSFAARTSMTWDGAITGIFLGLLVFSIAYNAAFYSVLRERFLVWQSLRALLYFALTVGLSPLDMGTALDAHGFARQVYICILFDLSVAVTGPFVRAYIEPGMLASRIYRLLGWTTPAVMLTTPAMLIADCPPLYMALRNAVLLGTMALMCFTVAQGWWRGSRTARFQAAAWSCVLVVYGISLFHDIVLHRPFTMFLFALFAALGFEVMLTAIGVGDRFLRLKRAHDEARATASALQQIAHTDPLTGLSNRRAVERAFSERAPDALAIIDLDHFKAVNDRYGHDIGDQVIRATAAALASGSAIAGRIGGEEFVLLLYGNAAQVQDEAERLRRRVTTFSAERVSELRGFITASMGLVLVGDASFSGAMKIADINLYMAKGAGRDRLILPTGLPMSASASATAAAAAPAAATTAAIA